MLKKIKEYFEYKKAKKMVTIMCLNEYMSLLATQTELQSSEKEFWDNFKSFNKNISIEEITEFLNNIDTFTKDIENPKSREKLYDTLTKFSIKDNSVSLKN